MLEGDQSTRPQGGRAMERCPICELPIRAWHKTRDMADDSHAHEVCFDIVLTAITADIGLVVGEDENVVFDRNGCHVEPK